MPWQYCVPLSFRLLRFPAPDPSSPITSDSGRLAVQTAAAPVRLRTKDAKGKAEEDEQVNISARMASESSVPSRSAVVYTARSWARIAIPPASPDPHTRRLSC